MSDEISVKVKWSLDGIREIFPALVKGAQKSLGWPILQAVKKEISQGKSPVEGEGRLRGYSPSYSNQIKVSLGRLGKRVRPVNLYLTGKLMASGYVKPVTDGVAIGFSDKKAVYHDRDGAGKSKVLRRMLPTRKGEIFSRTIMAAARKLLVMDVIRKAIVRTKKA